MIEVRIQQRRRDLGGFAVGRLLPYAKRRMVGPFIFFDHIGPVDFQPGIPRTVDVRPHPHIGLSTITYLFEGEIMHRDSIGSQQAIRPGEVNWMTAGSGITHSERFERARLEGGAMHGIQAWVALPARHEETEPSFLHRESGDLPSWEDGGIRYRLIAGEAYGMKSAVPTHSALCYLHCELAAGASLPVPDDYAERAAYVVAGALDADGIELSNGDMGVFAVRTSGSLRALAPTTLMLLGGEPIGERFIDWNFVSSSKERIEQAKADWRAGRMKLSYLDDQEFIPLPSGAGSPPNPMS